MVFIDAPCSDHRLSSEAVPAATASNFSASEPARSCDEACIAMFLAGEPLPIKRARAEVVEQ
jgi:hypothetical protein